MCSLHIPLSKDSQSFILLCQLWLPSPPSGTHFSIYVFFYFPRKVRLFQGLCPRTTHRMTGSSERPEELSCLLYGMLPLSDLVCWVVEPWALWHLPSSRGRIFLQAFLPTNTSRLCPSRLWLAAGIPQDGKCAGESPLRVAIPKETSGQSERNSATHSQAWGDDGAEMKCTLRCDFSLPNVTRKMHL